MPLPKPNSGENEKDFVARCVNIFTDRGEYKTREQRVAVCYSLYKKRNESFDDLSLKSVLNEIK